VGKGGRERRSDHRWRESELQSGREATKADRGKNLGGERILNQTDRGKKDRNVLLIASQGKKGGVRRAPRTAFI